MNVSEIAARLIQELKADSAASALRAEGVQMFHERIVKTAEAEKAARDGTSNKPSAVSAEAPEAVPASSETAPTKTSSSRSKRSRK